MRVTPEEYLPNLVDHGLVKVYALAKVEETKQIWSEEDDFYISKPKLTLKLDYPSVLRAKQSFDIIITFDNPLKEKLTNCILQLEGSGIQRTTKIRFSEDVEIGGTFTYRHRLYPKKTGSYDIVAVFNSMQLIDIKGSLRVDIKE